MIALISRQSGVARTQPGCWWDFGLTFAQSHKNLSVILAVRLVSFLLENRSKCVSFFVCLIFTFTWFKKGGAGETDQGEKKERRGSIAQESKKKHEGSEGVRGLKSRRSSDAADTPPSILWTCSIVRSLQRGSYLRSFIEAGAKKETVFIEIANRTFSCRPFIMLLHGLAPGDPAG